MRQDVPTRLRARWALVLGALLTLSACSPAGPAASNVQVTSATVTAQGQLSLHATATFEASVQDPNGLHQAADLRYHWSLDAGRGTYLPEGGEETTEVVTTASSLRLRGDVAGEETVRVTVVDASTDTTVGVGTIAFDITSPSATSNCFDGTTLFVGYGYPYSMVDTVDLETGERAVFTNAVVSDVSRDGNWFTGLVYVGDGLTKIFIRRCDGTEYRALTSGEHYEEVPKFAPDGRSIYFLRRADENVLYPDDGLAGFMEVGVVDVATGVSRILNNLNADAEGAFQLAVSPDGEKVAFAHYKVSKGGFGVTYVYDYELVTMPAGGGPLHSLAPLGDYAPLHGIDWSPDGRDIIFSWAGANQTEPAGESGIYRISATAGGAPQLILPDPSPDTLPPFNPTYYAGGTRIAWSGGREYGDTNTQVWSFDANGGDVKRLTDGVEEARLITIWDPF